MKRSEEKPVVLEDLLHGFDRERHHKATEAAVQALEVSGLQLEPENLSEMILRLYELASEKERAKAYQGRVS